MNCDISRLLPPVPVVILDFHVKSFAPLSNFVANLSHSNNPHSRPCDFNSHQAFWQRGSHGIHSYFVAYGKIGPKDL